MKIGYIETFAYKLAKNDHSIVSGEDLIDFKHKYNLTEEEMDEIKEYCKDHDISIVYKDDHEAESDRAWYAGRYLPKKERRRIIRTIADHIVSMGINRTKKREKERGWFCGTYVNRIGMIIERSMERTFTDDQIEFIESHLPEKCDGKTLFELQDTENMELCEEMNRRLNALIPNIGMHHYFSDYEDEL